MNNSQFSPSQALKQLTVLHGAMLMGVFFFGAAAWFIASQEEGPIGDKSMSSLFDLAVPVVAIMAIVVSHFLWQKQVSGIQKEDSLMQKLGVYRQASIVRFALLEGPALLAGVGYLLTGRSWYLIAMLGMAGVMFLFRPSRHKLITDLDLRDEEARQI